MKRFVRLTGIYFGVVEPTAEEKAQAAAAQPSRMRTFVAAVVTLIIATVYMGVVDGDAWHGLRFGILFLLLSGAIRLWENKRTRS